MAKVARKAGVDLGVDDSYVETAGREAERLRGLPREALKQDAEDIDRAEWIPGWLPRRSPAEKEGSSGNLFSEFLGYDTRCPKQKKASASD